MMPHIHIITRSIFFVLPALFKKRIGFHFNNPVHDGCPRARHSLDRIQSHTLATVGAAFTKRAKQQRAHWSSNMPLVYSLFFFSHQLFLLHKKKKLWVFKFRLSILVSLCRSRPDCVPVFDLLATPISTVLLLKHQRKFLCRSLCILWLLSAFKTLKKNTITYL